MTGALRRLWGSISLRLAFHYGVLVAITMLVSLGIVYVQTVGVMYQAMTRQVSFTAQLLAVRFDNGGVETMVAEITRALADGSNSNNAIYLLVDGAGQKLVGNIDHVPDAVLVTGRGSERRVVHAGQMVTAYLIMQTFADGSLLVVGQDLRELEAIKSLIVRASAAAGIVAVVLLIGGTFIFRQALEHSIGAVRRTAARIVAGDLQERVAVSGEDDEFALLNNDINEMLDRIESLMDGVRHVSNTIAHNLRTPLTRIVLRLRTAEDESIPPDERRAAIASAVREIEDLTVTFEKLLQIAEAEAGTRRRNFTSVALHTIADDVLELYDAVAESRSAVLRREPAERALVHGDSDLLASVVANLVDNALKYAGDSAVIRVGTEVTESGTLLTVQDNGPGVPAPEYSRIGTRFHRLDRNTPGHGLGLASVKALVVLHGGQVRFADAVPGLRVEIKLPNPTY